MLQPLIRNHIPANPTAMVATKILTQMYPTLRKMISVISGTRIKPMPANIGQSLWTNRDAGVHQFLHWLSLIHAKALTR